MNIPKLPAELAPICVAQFKSGAKAQASLAAALDRSINASQGSPPHRPLSIRLSKMDR